LFDTLNEGISQLDRDKIKSLRQVSADARELMMDILDGLVIEPAIPEPIGFEFRPNSPIVPISEVAEQTLSDIVDAVNKAPAKRNRSKKVVDNG
jgi:hypothetical protein